MGPLSTVPGPCHSRFSQLIYVWHRMAGTSILYTHSLFKRYGPIVRVRPGMVVICDDKVWDEVLCMGSHFRKAEFHERMRIGPDRFLFSIADPRQHAARRRLLARGLTMDMLRRNWEAQVRLKVDTAVDQIRAEAAGGGVADLFQWWRLMAADVIALLSFGEPFHMIETAGEGEREYFNALVDAGLNIVIRDLFPFLPLLARILPFRRLRNVVNADNIVTEKGTVAVRNMRSTVLDRPNLFSNMLAEAEQTQAGEKEGSSVLTDDAVRSEVAGFLLAGSDTTGFAMTMIIWAVLRRPQLQSQLEEEVAGLSPEFTDKDVEKLPLLNNVIDEAMRMYNPAGGGVMRKAPPEGATFLGHYLPGGTNLIVQHYSIARDPKLFPNPDR
jgi:cytochrome P450